MPEKESADKKVKISSLESDIKSKYLFIEEDNMVVFKVSDGIRVIHGDTVDEWHMVYTQEDLTVEEISIRYEIKKSTLKEMFRALGLTKSSSNRAPWVVRRSSCLERLAKETSDKIDSLYAKTYEIKRSQEIKRKYKSMLSDEYKKKSFFESVGKYSSSVPFVPPSVNQYEDLISEEFNVNIISVISDWHVGAKGSEKDMIIGSPYNSEVRDRRIDSLKKGLVSYRRRFRGKIGKIYGFVLGDMIDDPLGKTFPTQLKEQDLHGADQVVEAVRLIKSYILFFYDLFGGEQEWFFIKGNHGYEFEEVVYHWIKDSLADYDDISINVVPTRYANLYDEFSQTQIIAMHGDGGVDAKSASLMLDNGSKNRILVHGHKHSLSLEEMPRGFRVGCPSLVGGNGYSQSKNWNSSAGQVIIELHEDGPKPVSYFQLR